MVFLMGFMNKRFGFSFLLPLDWTGRLPYFLSSRRDQRGAVISPWRARVLTRVVQRNSPQASEPIPKVGSRGPAPAIPEEMLHGSSLIACGIFFLSPRFPPSFLPSIPPGIIPRMGVISQVALPGTRVPLAGVPPSRMSLPEDSLLNSRMIGTIRF